MNDTSTFEEWRDIEGYPGYEVSSLGRVRSPRGVLKSYLNPDGYRSLSICRDNKRYTKRVHRLVAEAFHGPRPHGQVARHVDGDSLNNLASNLRWGSPSENVQDSLRHGTNHEARKVVCPRGHTYDPENTWWQNGRKRRCNTCHRLRERARYHRLRPAEGGEQ